MLWDKPRYDDWRFATGPASTTGELIDATFQSGLYADNLDARDRAVGEAFDARNDAIFKSTGVRLDNPWRQLDVGAAELGQEQTDYFAEWNDKAAALAKNRPEFADIIKADRSPLDDARDKQRQVLAHAADVADRYAGPLPAWMAQLAGGLGASAFDKINLATLFVGPAGRVGTGAAAIAWNGIKSGAANAAVEATFQPSIAAWRKEAGLELTTSEIALNVGSAFGLGFGLDAGVRSAYRGVQGYRGNAPVLDDAGKVTGWKPDGAALEDAARNAPADSDLGKAAGGDAQALRKLAEDTGAINDPAVKGALDELDHALPEMEALREAGDIERMMQALRHAEDPQAHAPPTRGDATPDARGPNLADDAPPPPGGRFDMEGRPVTFAEVDPLELKTDASVFQFKAGGDAAGATERLNGVERWDPIAAGRAVVYQRRDGSMIIADGHQRLNLAKRLADQEPKLQAFVFREADGWQPGDIRALAAKKNLQEGSGTIVDAAAIMRERPDIIDKSVPLGSEAMRQARSLARLSDNAFDKVLGGVVPSKYAALLGDLVPDKGRHSGMVDELVAAEPANVREARFIVHELLHAPVHVEEQLTLLGSWRVERSLMKERVGVLDKALGQLKGDQRLFRTLDREAGRIEAAGNMLDKELNAKRSAEAAELSAVIEALAVQRGGPVSEWLNDAARAVAAGTLPKSRAAEAFARRVAETLERDGLNGLMREADNLRGAGVDEPGGADAAAQVKDLERSLGRDIELAKAPEKAAAAEHVLFALEDNGERAVANATVLREAANIAEVRLRARDYIGAKIENIDDGLEATVSNASLNKMLSLSAVGKSISPAAHMRAVANVDQLFRHAKRLETLPDRNNDPNILAVHRYYAPMVLDGRAVAVKMTVKELVPIDQGNRIYSVEAIEVATPARLGPSDGIEPDLAATQNAPIKSGPASVAQDLMQMVEEVNAALRAQKGPTLLSARESGPIGHTPRALERSEEVGRALRDTVDMLPADVRMRVEEKLTFAGVDGVEGYWSPSDRLVYVALSAADPVRVARHEVVHALRQSGLLSDAEFDLLYRYAAQRGLRDAYQIDAKYADTYGKAYGHNGDDHVEALLREETIAEMFADYALNGRRFGLEGGGAIDRIIDTITRFIERLRNALSGLGFRDARDVFEAIETGAVALRAALDDVDRMGDMKDLAEACKL